ncbi:MAG: DUF1566 domain-containing protein [Gammaproteobacteria bacterium]|nr:DUF1566 domain-containing protein [Gammaproteobacteria bacterium]MCP4091234.1 DUF1566 domain-containing protein [Gammaproteobacteria bacterium]MCP4278343.1 DUF1566 domain-containing protein [Gammaproteobacteria bacterium]MCP4830920.1 DUF1566 domain-containing protein [Gammaproteobacteria bacterium]MCP4927559.1 DUF1566 domain-containing protein [Gammaproteobacteria bacterium]
MFSNKKLQLLKLFIVAGFSCISIAVNAAAPSLIITSPYIGEPFINGAPIGFSATAIDPEDGDISHAIVWESDIDGYIGTGGVTSAFLSSGLHQIQVNISDGDNETTSYVRQIEVNASVCTDPGPSSYRLFGTNVETVNIDEPSLLTPALALTYPGYYPHVVYYDWDLETGDNNGVLDLYVYDDDEEDTYWVSPNHAGEAASPVPDGSGVNHHFSISNDGNLVAFNSWQTDMVADDTNDVSDVFVHDRSFGTTERVNLNTSGGQLTSVNSLGTTANAISGDGSKVVFLTDGRADPVVDQTDYLDIYVRELATGVVQMVSLDSQGNPQQVLPSDNLDPLQQLSCSDNCNVVAFVAKQAMEPADINGVYDIYVRDLATAKTQRITNFSVSDVITSGSLVPKVSADGNFIVYQSPVDNASLGDGNEKSDIYLYNRATLQTTLVSVNDAGTVGNGDSFRPSVSADGRVIAFESEASNLDSKYADVNNQADVFVHNMQAQLTYRVSIDYDGQDGQEDVGKVAAFDPIISGDGLDAVFKTSIDLDGDGSTKGWDIYESYIPYCKAGNSAPIAYIINPAAPLAVLQGQTIALDGYAIDAEDGVLSDSLTWNSDLDGSLGSGASITTALSSGQHTVSVSVTDSGGLLPQVVETLSITVLSDADADGMDDGWEALYGVDDPLGDADGDGITNIDEYLAGSHPADTAPTITISEPDSVSIVLDTTVVNLAGVATDIEDGDISGSILWSSSIDSALGVGSSVQGVSLSLGVHTISATVQDSQGQVPVTLPTIEISVVAPVGLLRDGDADQNGKLDIRDLLAVEQHITQIAPLNSVELMQADLYPAQGDGVITVADLLLLQRAVSAGTFISTPPVLTPPVGDVTNIVPYVITGAAGPGVLVRVYLDGELYKTVIADGVTGAYSVGIMMDETQPGDEPHEIWAREYSGLVEGASSDVISIEYLRSSGIPQTGEDQSFANYDDYSHQAGMPRRFIRDDINEIVTDQVTGLVWLDTSETKTLEQTQSQARSYCTNLTQGGLTWRLPTRHELLFLVDHNSAYLNAIPDPHTTDRENRIDSNFYNKYTYTAFQVKPYIYWTKEVWNGSANPWYVDFNHGRQGVAGTSTESGYARCVSGSPARFKTDFQVGYTGDDVVVDIGNQLMWQDAPDNATLNTDWQGALQYCELLDLGGKTDWRLPNVNEGITLLDAIKGQKLTHTNADPDPANNSPDAFWWTSTNAAKTTHRWGQVYAWALFAVRDLNNQFSMRQSEQRASYTDKWLRCVRDYAPAVAVITTTSQTVGIADPVTFDGSNSLVQDGIIIGYRWWDITNSQEVGTEALFVKSDLAAGDHEIELQVTDAYGIESVSDPITITVIVDNVPVARAGANQVVATGAPAALDGTNSYAAEGSLVAYEWREGAVVLSTASSFSKSDFSVGAHTIDLTVTDSRGATATDSVVITIQDPPVADPGEPQTVEAGNDVILDASDSMPIEGTIVSYEWFLGGVSQGTGPIITVPDLAVGTHIIELIVVDSQGVAGSSTVEITIEPPVYPMATCTVEHVSDDSGFIDTHPENDIPWVGADFTDVSEIEAAFNHARLIDGQVFQYLQMPSQVAWDAMTAQQQGLYLVNAERQARGLKPYEGISPNVVTVAQGLADYIRQHDVEIDHYADGNSPYERLDSDLLIRDNRDWYVLPESIYSYYGAGAAASDAEGVVRAVYTWIYEDKVPLSGAAWGHRDHMLQADLNENSSESYREGLAGFGISSGAYDPGDNPGVNGIIVVLNTFDPSDTWDHATTVTVDTDGAQFCEGNVVINVDQADVPNVGQLKSLMIAPTDVLLTVGGSVSLTVTGTYQDDSAVDLTSVADFIPGVRSVVSVVEGNLTSLRQGSTFVSAQVNSIKSNRVYVQVGGNADITNLTGTFAADYLAHIPANATIGSYDPKAVSLFTGMVTVDGTAALQGVTVSVFGHPEYGSVKTDASGQFTMLAEAGSYKFVYRKHNYLTVHRDIQAASNAWAVLEDVVLLQVDNKQTDIDLTNPTSQIHKSTRISDARGDRETTLVFDGVTSATVTSFDGSQYTLDDLTVRATEYEVPASMPAELPVESAFTYCSELEVVGLRDDDTVTFDQPVVMYVDNFLNFPVGEIVPIGYYDRTLGSWEASPNGVVVELLDADSNGQVDGVDYTGDGVADDIDNSGSTTDEVAGIEGYTAGDTYWRGSFDHFTPNDFNWPANAPNDAETSGTPDAKTSKEETEDSETACVSSYVKPYQQSFHEDVPIIGTGLSLHYSSQRTPGYHHKINVPVSDANIPASMTEMTARLEIGGHSFEQSFAAAANVSAEFSWDGNDPVGNRIDGVVEGRVYIGYTYATEYASAGNAVTSGQTLDQFPVAWAQPGTGGTGVTGRDTFTAWNSRVISVQNTYPSQIANGWSISNYHEESRDGLVYKGDGSVQEADKGSRVLKTGIQNSQYNYDDGHYEAGGSTIDYAITDEGVLQDQVTGLEWQYITTPARFRDKDDAINYCSSQVLPLGTGWRLPTEKEIAYSIDKSIGDHYFPIYRFEALNYWSEFTYNSDNSLLPVICVRGDKIDDLYIAGLQRDASRDVVVDSQNALMWQDIPDNKTVTRTWEASIDYCEASEHAGYDNWRLPNINELAYTLPNSVFVNATIFPPETPWSPTAPDRKPYWSSTPNALDGDELQAWAMESNSASSNVFIKADAYYARCVRDDDTSLKSPFRFDQNGRHEETIDLDTGNTLVTFNHDINGELSSIIDQFSNQVTIDRSVAGEISIASHDGYTTKLTIDTVSNEIDRIDYDDSTYYEFGYAAGSLMDQETDRNESVFGHLFDAEGRVYQTSDPESGQWTFSAVEQPDNSLLYGYGTAESNSYQTIRSILGDGSVQKQTTFVDGRVSTNTFLDDVDGATETIASCGVTTQIDYVLDDRTLQDIPGTITVTVPNTAAASNLVNTTVITKAYAESGADKSAYTLTTTENGNQPGTIEFEALVDTTTNRTKVTSPEGRETTYDYYADSGLLKSITPPGGLNTISYTYDARGRVETVTTGTRTQTYFYDDAVSKGAVTKSIADDGKETQFSYDAVGRVDIVTQPDLSTIDADYDGNDNVTVLQTPRLKDYGFGFTDVDNVETETTPLTETTTYIYDKDRRLTEIIYPSGPTIKTVNTYANGVLDYSDTPQGRVDYSYGTCGSQVDIISENWSGETVNYDYDGNLLVGVTYVGELNQAITQKFNNEFRVSSISYAGLIMTDDSISYDDDGVLTGIHGYTITPKTNSPLPETFTDSTFSQARGYNAYGELNSATTTVNSAASYDYTLTYNDLGQIVTRVETLHDGTVYNYEYVYDPNRRWLKQVKRDDGAGGALTIIEDYSYDVNGNRSITGTTSTYNDGDQLTDNGAGTSYTYTPEGHLATKTMGGQTTTYSYSKNGRLLSVTPPSPAQAITYGHNAIGNRVSKSVGGVVQEHYLWLDKVTLLAVYDAGGNLKQRFEYTLGNTPTSFMQGISKYYITTDHLGSPRTISDASGNLVKAYSYDAYGNRTTLVDNNASVEIPFGFAGGLYDEDTGLVRFGYRDYDPEVGRWTASDPIGFKGLDANLYAYVFGNPLSLIDPIGTDAINIRYQNYPVNTEMVNPITGKEIYISAHHAAVISVNPDTGGTRYYEYGRYDDDNKGEVRRRTVPDLVMIDGAPTPESLDNLYSYISKELGKDSDVLATYHEDADHAKVNEYAETVMNDSDRPAYSLITNNCGDFANRAIIVGRGR